MYIDKFHISTMALQAGNSAKEALLHRNYAQMCSFRWLLSGFNFSAGFSAVGHIAISALTCRVL